VTSDPLAHAVAQTIAAERLEGWAPTDEHVVALRALARDDVTFPEYLAPFRARHPPPARDGRRWRLRRVPYLIPGTHVLRNEFGARSGAMLAELEFVATAGRMMHWLRALDEVASERRDRLDVRVLHRHLFVDVYSWAGELRTTELRRGDHGFAWQSALSSGIAGLHDAVAQVSEVGVAQDGPRLEYELARLYADYNQLHPFREGNGRAGALLLHGVAARCGRRLDLSGITREQWYAAAADSMPFRRDGRASHRPFLYLLLGASSPRNVVAPDAG
jgi:cell filamentation protein